jgi:polyferredoxin
VTRATLHDELMREAGFETDYHREIERRRERRRHARAWTIAHALLIVLLIAAVIELWGHYLPGLPRPLVVTAIVVLGIARVFGWLKALKEAMEP